MVFSSPPLWLSQSEFEEFNDITYDKLKSWTSISKLKRLEKYMREEGFFQTAEVARKRIIEQGGIDPCITDTSVSPKEADDLLKGLQFWQENIKEKDAELQKLQDSISKTGSDSIPDLPKVRNADPDILEMNNCNNKDEPKKNVKKDIRSGRKYYEGWDKYVCDWEKENAEDKDINSTKIHKQEKVTEKKKSIANEKPLVEREWLANREREKGNDLFKAKEYAASLQAYTNAIDAYKGSPTAYANRAAVYLKMNRYDDAYADCTEALKLDPHNMKAFMRRAKASLEMGKPTRALHDIEEALRLDPKDEESLCLKKQAEEALRKQNVGCIPSAQDKLPGGRRIIIEEIERVPETEGEQMENRLQKDVTEDYQERVSEAIKEPSCGSQEIDKSDQGNQKSISDNWHARGNVFFKAKNYGEACECYTKSLNHAPNNVVVLSNRALCQLKLKNYTAAEEDASSAITLDSNFVKAFHHRAMARHLLGKLQEGIEDLQKVLEAFPGDKKVASELMKMEADLNSSQYLPKRQGPMIIEEIPLLEHDNTSFGNVKVVCQELVHSDKLHISNEKSQCEELVTADEERVKGNNLFKSGQYEAALDFYTKSIELDSSFAATYTNRALCYLKLNNPEKAIYDCNQAITLEPDNRKAYYRRVIAKKNMQNLSGALEDLNVLRELCPDDSSIDEEARAIEIELTRCKEGRKTENVAFNCNNCHNVQLQRTLDVSKILENKENWESKIVYDVPKTAIEFERSFLNLFKEPGLLKKYLLDIKPTLYPLIFKEDLSARIMKLVGCFLKDNIGLFRSEEVIKILEAFVRVRRFKMVMMLLASCEREVFRELFQLMGEASVDINELRCAYVGK